jgi:dTDP-4-dehydrorhamnose 3,5-epimerase/reductase
MSRSRTLIVGAGGQLGRALRHVCRHDAYVDFAQRADLDLTSPTLDAYQWSEYDTIVNAAAYTAVDAAETAAGRRAAWAVNVTGVGTLARIASTNGITLVHVSSDYVFDGSSETPYGEDDPVSPLGVYGQTKAAGDQIVATVHDHYIVRTSWVIGDGKNFVRTMLSLAERGIDPSVVDDQVGRLTFASEIARSIQHLLSTRPAPGIYNVTNVGEPTSWADVGRRVFELSGHSPDRITGVTTEVYFAAAAGPVAPRPRNSLLDTSKMESTGFAPETADQLLCEYVAATV